MLYYDFATTNPYFWIWETIISYIIIDNMAQLFDGNRN